VADNIEQASKGVEDVNENVAQSSQVSSEIAKDITDVNSEAEQMYERSARMNGHARDLFDLAGALNDMISVFKVSVDMSDQSCDPMLDNKENIPDLLVHGTERRPLRKR